MPTAVELKKNRNQIWERMKAIVDLAETENRNLSTEEETNWNQANTDIGELDKRIERQERMERTPAAAPAGGNLDIRRAVVTTRDMPVAELRATPEYATAYGRWLRCVEDMDDRALLRPGFVQERAMGTTSGAAGGFLVPEGFQRKMEQALLDYGGMRSAATIIQSTDGADLPMPTSDDTSNTGEIVAEGRAVTEQDVAVGAKVLRAYMYSSKMVRVSLQFLQDSAIDVEGWLAGLLGERIARITNTHFTTGASANEPQGIVTGATSGVAGATGQTVTCTWDNLIDLEHSVGSAYRRGARYMFADTTLGILRKLKDGEGRYLWLPGQPTAGVPNTINGWAYTINDDVAAMAASAKSILFGQLSKYIIRDVRGFALRRLEERYAEYLQVAFLGFSRHDGVLLDAGQHPVRYYSNSAS